LDEFTNFARGQLERAWERYHQEAPESGIITSSWMMGSRGDRCDLLIFHTEDYFLAKAEAIAPYVVTLQCYSFWTDYKLILQLDEIALPYDGRVYVGYDWDTDQMVFCCTAETDAVTLRMILPHDINDL
jgi:hypothetical protein